MTAGVDTSVWPPRYDPAYRPDPTADYWFPELECLSPETREALILDKLRRQVAWAWERSPFYRRKWDAAGVSPATLRSLEDLAKFPVVQKAELRLSQAAAPPYGEYLCIEPGEVARIHGTSGTTGRPTVFGIGSEDWARIGEAHGRILWAAGLRPDDRVLICSFFSLYLGSWGALRGVERLGATAFPFGAGVPGQTLMAVEWAQALKPTAFYGTPSYALHFAETARREGLDPVDAHRPQLATDQPARLRRRRPLDGRAVPVRADVSATAGRALRADRRHVHRPGREYLPERDRGHAARDRRVRRRVSGHRLAPRDDGRALDPRRLRREPRRSRAPGEALRHGDRAAPRAARGPPRRRARPRGHLAAYRVQGSPSHRRPRSLPSRPPGGASVSPHVETLAREVVEGSPRALARALTWVESGGDRAETLAARLYAHTGRAHGVGMTGAPGSGESKP